MDIFIDIARQHTWTRAHMNVLNYTPSQLWGLRDVSSAAISFRVRRARGIGKLHHIVLIFYSAISIDSCRRWWTNEIETEMCVCVYTNMRLHSVTRSQQAHADNAHAVETQHTANFITEKWARVCVHRRHDKTEAKKHLPIKFHLPHATFAFGSCFKWASNTASLIWSHILSV